MLPCSLKLDAPAGWPLSPSRNWTKNVQLKPMKSSHADQVVSRVPSSRPKTLGHQ